jgi:hypothetical protein
VFFAREVVRCTTLVYYLGNPAWRAGDGAEIALYTGTRQDHRLSGGEGTSS